MPAAPRTAARRLARALAPAERCMVVGSESVTRRIRVRLERGASTA